MLLQSRASRVSDVLTLRDTDEIASSPPGTVQDVVTRKIREEIKEVESGATPTAKPAPETEDTPKIRYATIRNGKAEFEKP